MDAQYRVSFHLFFFAHNNRILSASHFLTVILIGSNSVAVFCLRAFLSIIRKCTDLKELTPELVNRLITKIEIFDSTKDENGKKHVPIKVHFIGVGILEIPDTQTIIAAKEEIRKNPPSAA